MKKIIIAGASVAAFGLAVVPFTGVVEAVSHTDTVKLTVPVSCSLKKGGTAISGDSSADITFDSKTGSQSKAGTTLTVYCNKTGWSMTVAAVGQSGAAATTSMRSNTGYDIVTGTATTGNTANWAVKLTVSNATLTAPTGDSTWNNSNFNKVPASTAPATISSSQVNNTTEASIAPTYQVFTPTTQPAGLYQGAVKYTFTAAT